MTRNRWGKGQVSYLGFMPTDALAEKILADEVRRAGAEVSALRWPLVVRGGTLNNGHTVRYVLNYSNQPQNAAFDHRAGTELLSGKRLAADTPIALKPWGVAIVEEDVR
jgi:beta-galactosidase